DTEEITRMSQNPQDEVACGLVLQDQKLQELDINLNTIYKYEITNLTQLQLFFDTFHDSLDDLRIEDIKAIEGYNFNKPEYEYNQKLWRATERELRNLLNSQKGDIENIQPEPHFIVELKALVRVLYKEIDNL
ncbi:MAG: hypothetical protein ACKPBB_03600, partial [Sphaerospermopsis kisseleviana]